VKKSFDFKRNLLFLASETVAEQIIAGSRCGVSLGVFRTVSVALKGGLSVE
jgi:hypothetical protein